MDILANFQIMKGSLILPFMKVYVPDIAVDMHEQLMIFTQHLLINCLTFQIA